MRFGAVLPQMALGADSGAAREFVQSVEDLGYDHVLAYDHVLGVAPGNDGKVQFGFRPYTHEHPFREPLVFLGFLAAVTTRIELATGILVLPQRQTALVAKQAAEVDILSGGRLRLGVGVGWNEPEYDALGADFRTRGVRIEEQVEVLRRLWSGPVVEFQGRFHEIVGAGINPLPVQRPIPIWYGGLSDAVLRRVARSGQGWIGVGDSVWAVERLEHLMDQVGRPMEELGIECLLDIRETDPEDWRSFAERASQGGVTHMSAATEGFAGAQFSSITEHLSRLSKFIESVK